MLVMLINEFQLKDINFSGLCLPFFLYSSSFLITFSGLLRNNMYNMLCIFLSIKVCSSQNWQNCIERNKSARARAIPKMKKLRPLNYWPLIKNKPFELFSSYHKHFLIFFSINEYKKILKENFLMASLMRNDQKCWFWEYFSP